MLVLGKYLLFGHLDCFGLDSKGLFKGTRYAHDGV